MMCRPINAARCDFRLKDRRHRLWFAGQPALHPFELRRIERGQLYHRQMYANTVVQQLRTQRVGEAADRVLCSAVSRLQRNAAVCESRADLNNDTAISRNHVSQRGHGSMHNSEVGDFGYPLKLLHVHLLKRREHGHHCVIDPDVDWSKLPFNRRCRRLDLFP
jgi:hypothetical protein